MQSVVRQSDIIIIIIYHVTSSSSSKYRQKRFSRVTIAFSDMSNLPVNTMPMSNLLRTENGYKY
jgi:hypothetical protein